MLSTGKLDELTNIDRTAFTWNARGTDNSDIAGAYFCFTNGDYAKSLTLLDRYLRLEPRGDLVPYVHYTAGAVSLIASKQSYLTIFQTHNGTRVSEALQHLSLAIGQTSNRRLLEESRLLRAKAYLLLQRPYDAIADLDTVRSLSGPRSEEAMQMIERIHALTP
jgi:tetratricopeptide (TPR) repeat protein